MVKLVFKKVAQTVNQQKIKWDIVSVKLIIINCNVKDEWYSVRKNRMKLIN
jgi:hypothetical protein